MSETFKITVDQFTFECLTDSLKGAWDVIRNDGTSTLTVGRLTPKQGGIDIMATNRQTVRLLPTQSQIDRFVDQWVEEAKRRREDEDSLTRCRLGLLSLA